MTSPLETLGLLFEEFCLRIRDEREFVNSTGLVLSLSIIEKTNNKKFTFFQNEFSHLLSWDNEMRKLLSPLDVLAMQTRCLVNIEKTTMG